MVNKKILCSTFKNQFHNIIPIPNEGVASVINYSVKPLIFSRKGSIICALIYSRVFFEVRFLQQTIGDILALKIMAFCLKELIKSVFSEYKTKFHLTFVIFVVVYFGLQILTM